ncbi:MAG: TRAP transporter permease [Desulfobacteraceae bacterium]|nr:TRAP transporter permease [Desulfobacteraceae bacterium]
MQTIDSFQERVKSSGIYIAAATRVIAVAYSFFHLWIAGIGVISTEASRHINLIGTMALVFLLYPLSKKTSRHWTFALEIVLIALAITVGVYLEIEYESLFARYGQPNSMDIIFGLILIVLTLEIARRAIGIPMVLVVLLFILYTAFGNLIPGYWGHRGQDLDSFITNFYLSDGGIYGTPIGVVVEFVVLFILFGAFLQKTGAGKYFIELSQLVTGNMRGGAAKAAVISSAMMGSITGSPAANVVTTGSITIPMMKRGGYPPHMAAGTEVAASVGGVLLPPIMGEAAFLIVPIAGIAYGKIIVAAALPAVLYFLSVYANVHFYACKMGIKPDQTNLGRYRDLWDILQRGTTYFLPIGVLVYLLVTGWSATFSAFCAIPLLIFTSLFRKETRISFKGFFEALELGAINSLPVAAACAAVGMIIGCVELNGVGIKFTSLMTMGSSGNLFVAILLVGLASLVLGIELPISAAYLIVAILAAPALIKLGVPVLPAHLICVWFAIDSAVTPPVCITSYIAAGVAKAHPFKTGFCAWKMAKGLYIIPFLMAYTPITLNGPAMDVFIAFISGAIGLISLSAAWEGYFLVRANIIERILLASVVITAIYPSAIFNTIGFVTFISVIFVQMNRRRSIPMESRINAV